MPENKPDTFARLRWRCRRGIREMDLLCRRFLDEVYPELSPPEQAAFARLLEEPDLDILAWATGRAEPTDERYHPLVSRMRELHAGGPERK